MFVPVVDFASDYLTWDKPESVRLDYSRRLLGPLPNDPQLRKGAQTPPFDSAAVADASHATEVGIAKRRAIRTAERSPSGGAYTGAEVRWLIPGALVPSDPKPGDVVVDGKGVRWTALTVETNRHGATFVLGCVALAVAFDLRDTIDVERPAVSYDAAGAPVMAFPSDPTNPGGEKLYSALLCRVQLLTQEVREERGIRGLESAYDVMIEQTVRVTMQDRIFWRGTYLDITGFKQADRIDQLNVIEAKGKV
jgi:hypothetical protein